LISGDFHCPSVGQNEGMRVVVGGGSGFVGKNLCKLLKRKGHDVVVVSRTAAKPPVEGCEVVSWDSVAREGLPTGTDAAVNLAGANILDPLKRWNSYAPIVRSSRLESTTTMASAVAKATTQPKVFISASAVGYYPPSETACYDEDSICAPNNFIEQLVHDWEAAAQLPETCQSRLVKLRIGVVVGKGGGIVGNTWLPFYLGLGGPISSGKQWFPWVHNEDVAGIILHAIENENVTGVLNAVSPQTATNADFSKSLAAAMWRPAFFPLPGFVVNTIFGQERGAIMLEGQRVNPKRTLDFGYEFQYPHLKEACEEVVKSDKK